MAERSKARVYGCSLAGIAGSKPVGVMNVCLLWVLSGRGFCDGPIPRPEESYRLRCVVVLPSETTLLSCRGVCRRVSTKNCTAHRLRHWLDDRRLTPGRILRFPSTTTRLYQIVTWCLPKSRRTACTADNSPSSSTAVKNVWSYIPSIPYVA